MVPIEVLGTKILAPIKVSPFDASEITPVMVFWLKSIKGSENAKAKISGIREQSDRFFFIFLKFLVESVKCTHYKNYLWHSTMFFSKQI
jgi:hypothetical protein